VPPRWADGAFGNFHLAGTTDAFLGRPNAGGSDVVLSKLDADGEVVSARHAGSSGDDAPIAVVAGHDGSEETNASRALPHGRCRLDAA
jgi:hypothetical protein